MNRYSHKYLLSRLVISIFIFLLAGCQSYPSDRGQQYGNQRLSQSLTWVRESNAKGKPVNVKSYLEQIAAINQSSPRLYNGNRETFNAVQKWLESGGDSHRLSQFGLHAYQMAGVDGFGNVQFTGYYTPIVEARRTPQGKFRYPLYAMPPKGKEKLPHRQAIYAGVLDKHDVAIAFTNSLIDNFIMEVQGSGYVDFGDRKPLTFFAFAGKNGYTYRSIGKVLTDSGEIALADMSTQAIRHWAATHSEAELKELLIQNPSFVFFQPIMDAPVKGASAVPLIAQASVASDPSLIPAGTTLLAEIPLLDQQGKFTGKYQMRLMVSLDVGGAIKGHHLDIYQGIGNEAAHEAGFYNHYGRVWVLK